MFRAKDASSLPQLMTLANLVCSLLWALYGWETNTLPVLVANSTSAFVNAFLGLLCLTFRGNSKRD